MSNAQFNAIMRVTVFSHFFKITKLTPQAKNLIYEFSKRFVMKGLERGPRGRYVMKQLRVFAAATKDREQFHFHINSFEDFKAFLKEKHISDSLVEIKYQKLFKPKEVHIPIREGWSAREHQVPIVDYLTADIIDTGALDEVIRSRLVGIQTGKGKTSTSLFAISKIGCLTVVIVRPMFMGKWLSDIIKVLEVEPKEVLSVRGSAQLKALINLALTDKLNAKFVIVSNKTMHGWLKHYEISPRAAKKAGYKCDPEDFFKVLGAAVRLIDEVHLDFHLNFRLDLYTHIPIAISLSATLFNNNKFLEDMYEVAYPKDKSRYNGGELDRYANAFSVHYSFKDYVKLNTTEFGSSSYSHNAYEKSIIRKQHYLDSYFSLIIWVAKLGFFKDYKPGERMAIFVASIAMATELSDFLKMMYPDLKVNRFVEQDPDENLLESDISVTTILSGGTAHDIPNLKAVILTVAVDSIQSNVQTLGRLRKLEDTPTRFYYFVNESVPKHVDYHKRKKDMLQERAATYRELFYPYQLG